MQYYDVVYLFKTSEIRTDFGVLNAVMICHGRQMHILFEKNRIDIPTVCFVYICLFNLDIESYVDDESLNRVPVQLEKCASQTDLYDVLIESVRLYSPWRTCLQIVNIFVHTKAVVAGIYYRYQFNNII